MDDNLKRIADLQGDTFKYGEFFNALFLRLRRFVSFLIAIFT